MPCVKAQPEHDALRKDLVDYIAERHCELSGEEVLAVVAQLLGHLLVVQDPGEVRSDGMLQVVNANILIGQREARRHMLKGTHH